MTVRQDAGRVSGFGLFMGVLSHRVRCLLESIECTPNVWIWQQRGLLICFLRIERQWGTNETTEGCNHKTRKPWVRVRVRAGVRIAHPDPDP